MRPVIVGGAAVELYTQGAIVSGDIDVVTPWQESFEKALEQVGFGVEVVGRQLMEGHADQDRVLIVDLEEGTNVSFLSIEDLIADRMGQYNAPPSMRHDMLMQAAELLKLAENVDKSYLDQRINDETARDFGLAFLEEYINAQNNA